MTRSLVAIVAFASIACAAHGTSVSESRAAAAASEDWMPLRPGVRWIYDAERKNWMRFKGGRVPKGNADSVVHEIRVEGIDDSIGGGLVWRAFFGDGGGFDQLRSSSGTAWVLERVGPSLLEIGRILDSHESGPKGYRSHGSQLRNRRDSVPGMKWKYEFYRSGRPIQLSAEVVGFEDVVTPAGRFPQCLKIHMSGAWYDPSSTPGEGRPMGLEVDEWWARGVGKVKHVQRLAATDSRGGGSYSGIFIESTMVLREWYEERAERRVFPVRVSRPWREQRAEVTNLLEQGRYDVLEAKIGALEAGQQRGEITTRELSDLYGVFVGTEREVLDRWVTASPNSHIPRAARGIHLTDRSWELRGSRRNDAARFRALGEAGTDLVAALEIREDHAPSLRSLFNAAMWAGDSRMGAAVFAQRRAIETDPVDAYREVIHFLNPRRGGSEAALLRLADDALEYHGPGEVADRVRGRVLTAIGARYEYREPERAAALYEEAAPLGAFARRWRARFLRDQGRFREALSDLEGLMSAAPARSEWLRDRAEIYQRLGYHEYAFADLDLALAENPEDAELHAKRAEFAQDAGRFDEAVASWDRTVELDPRNRDHWKARGDLFLDLQQPRRAAASYRHAVELKPGNARYQYYYASALYHAGDALATRELQRYLELSEGVRAQAAKRGQARRMLAAQPASPDPAAH